MFSARATLEKFENATITSHFGFVFEENLGSEIRHGDVILMAKVRFVCDTCGIPHYCHRLVSVNANGCLYPTHAPLEYLFLKCPVITRFEERFRNLKAPFS